MEFVESQSLEFKERFNDSCKHTIVAFLSHGSGVVYVGINKYGKPVKLADIDEIQRDISNFIIDQVSPRCVELVKTSLVDIDGFTVIKIEVIKGDKLFYIKKYGLSVKGCYTRVGSTTREMNDEEIKKKYESTLNIPEKDITEIEAYHQDLTFAHMKNYLISKGFHINEKTFAQNYKLLTKNGKYNHMAEILADKNDIHVNVMTFKGKDKTQYLKRDEFGYTCLLYAYERAKSYVDAINQTFVEVKSGPRREKKMFDPDAFREARVNACVHNKWSESSCPGIYIYEDRLVIQSFGIHRNLTTEEILKGISKPVNECLMDIFLKCGFCEQSGHGVPEVVNKYGKSAYEFEGSFILVTIPFDKKGFSDDVGVNVGVNENIDQLIISEIRSGSNLKAEAMANKYDVSTRTIERHLAKLKKQGIIIRVASDKKGYWELKDIK